MKSEYDEQIAAMNHQALLDELRGALRHGGHISSLHEYTDVASLMKSIT